jgi:hypothetical protein
VACSDALEVKHMGCEHGLSSRKSNDVTCAICKVVKWAQRLERLWCMMEKWLDVARERMAKHKRKGRRDARRIVEGLLME